MIYIVPWLTSFVTVKKKSAISVDLFPHKVMPNLISCGPFISTDKLSNFFPNNVTQLENSEATFQQFQMVSIMTINAKFMPNVVFSKKIPRLPHHPSIIADTIFAIRTDTVVKSQ